MAYQRRAFVWRLYGKDNSDEEGGSDCSDCWFDIEVIAAMMVEQGQENQYQEWIIALQKDLCTEVNNPFLRQLEFKKAKNPDDESQWINVPTTVALEVEEGASEQYQNLLYVFDNSKTNKSRITKTRKLTHFGIDDDFLDGGDEDGNNKQPPHNPQDYLDAVTSSNDPDDTQKLEVEIVMAFIWDVATGEQYQETIRALKWDEDILLKTPLVDLSTDGE